MFLAMVPEGTPNPVDVVREVIVQAMATGEIPSRDADLAAAAAIGTVMQPATYKLYGRFEGLAQRPRQLLRGGGAGGVVGEGEVVAR